MSTNKKSTAGKFVSGFVGIMTAVMMTGGSMVHTASAQSAADLQAQIASLLATIQSLQAQLSTLQGGGTTGGTTFTFSRNLKQGDTGTDVKNLQTVLNTDPATQVAATGVGSAGNETTFFGSLTKAAVIKFQNKFASEILAPLGLVGGTGFVGASTRAKLNTMSVGGSSSGSTSGGGTPPPTGADQLTVSSASQPANNIAPKGAARVPFTKFTLTAGSQEVVVTGVNVERAGFGENAAFAGVVLLDEMGTQLGIAKTLNSLNQATLSESVTIPAGTSKTFTVAGNMAASQTGRVGQVVGMNVTGVTTSTSVSGSFPITGAQHTINDSLTIGTATANRSSLDPNVNVSKEIGTTGYTFSAIRVTAGSAEELSLNSIRFNQTGSASKNDLDNVKVIVDGQEFTPVVSADGKFYTAQLGGITIAKGLSKEISIKGNIISGSNRTVVFDIDKTTDLNVSGKTFGFGITPSAGSTATAATTSSQFTTGTPWYDNAHVTITAGSVTTVTKSNTVAAQNIAIQTPNQPLGGFEIDVKGEPISVQSLVFNFVITSTSGQVADITNISLVRDDGSVVAGPVDGSGASVGGTATFSDTVTFPTGKSVYTLKGQLGSDFANNQTIVATTTPSSDWTSITGQVTGDTITLTNGIVTMNTMTVKAATTTVTVSATPSSQNVVMGVSGFTFANFQYDATASGEDITVSSQQYQYTDGGSDPVNCFAWDGATRLNNTAINPSGTGLDTYTFDNKLTIPKGTVKVVTLKCDIPSNLTADEDIIFGITEAATMEGTGVGSGQTIDFTTTAGNSGTMTLKSAGTLAVVKDASSPSYALGAAGTAGNVIGVLKFTATNEEITVEDVKLTLTGGGALGTASTSPSDLTQVTLWDGATQVGTAIFTGSNTTATSSLSGTFTVPKDGDKLMTIKADFSEIGTSKPGRNGHLVKINSTGAGTVKGKGSSSGTSIYTTSAASAVDGVRVFRSFPTIAKVAVPTNILDNGSKSLLRFKVTAHSKGDVGIAKFTLRVATTGATVDSLNVFGYTDSGFSTPISGVRSDGGMLSTDLTMNTWASASTDLQIHADASSSASTTIQVPAGTSRYFEVVGVMSAVSTGDSVSTQLQGDADFHALAACASNSGCTSLAATVDADADDDFIWSGNATTSSGLATHLDWANGFGVVGLPSANMTAEVLSK